MTPKYGSLSMRWKKSKKFMINIASFQRQKRLWKIFHYFNESKFTLRKFASFIGTLTSSLPVKHFGPLNYRAMLEFKEYNKVKFNAIIRLAEDCMKYHGSKRSV